MNLKCPESYNTASKEDIDKVSNGCGPKWLPKFEFFNKILGTNIKEACDIHDWEYTVSDVTVKNKLLFDYTLLINLLLLIKNSKSKYKVPKYSIAFLYYIAVSTFGWISFLDRK